MSSHTWTPTELESSQTLFVGNVWRCISRDSNQAIAKLVNSASDARILELMLQKSKPYALPDDYLEYDRKIYGPFEHGPHMFMATRFRPVGGHGVFYSAFDKRTALIEQAWHRRNFVLDSEGLVDVRGLPLQVFEVSVRANLVNTQLAPFEKDAAFWLSKNDYSKTQEFASVARDSGINAIRYASVRNFPEGECLAILDLSVITSKKPNSHDGYWWLSFNGDTASLIHDQLMGSGDAFEHEFSD